LIAEHYTLRQGKMSSPAPKVAGHFEQGVGVNQFFTFKNVTTKVSSQSDGVDIIPSCRRDINDTGFTQAIEA
jgi:hypothetical protein